MAQLGSSLKTSFSNLTWKDLEPIEERLAMAQVSKSGFFFIAPGLMVFSVFVTWLLFPTEQGTDSTGLFFGSAAIISMAWAFLLASRITFLELAFGGFDRVYVWHRWAGIASVVFLYLHTSSENEVSGGIRPFGTGAEEAGLVMASPAQTALVVLVIISILRVLPYRIWRFSHIALIVPFVFSAWHALTAVRPSGLFDLTGWWLWTWSFIGLLAFVYRIIVVDSGFFNRNVQISELQRTNAGIRMDLSSNSAQGWNSYKPGQFIFLRVGGPWRESHPYSIVRMAKNPDVITVFIRQVGDWSRKNLSNLTVGDVVKVSSAHGHLELTSTNKPLVWIAGGSGITPFLQSESFFRHLSQPPSLTYYYRGEDGAFGLDYLRNLSKLGLIGLKEIDTSMSSGKQRNQLSDLIFPGSQVVVCGPRKLVVDSLRQARKRKAHSITFEIYDYRSPFGPNLNPLLKALLKFLLPSKMFTRLRWLFDEQSDVTLSH